MRVLFLTNVPSPYRVSFFQEIGKLCELTVAYEMKAAKDRDEKWKEEIQEKSYCEVYMKAVFHKADQACCPEVKKVISKGSFDLIIVGTYSTPTGILAVNYMKKKQIPYIINSDGGFPSKVATILGKIKNNIKYSMLSTAEAYLSTGAICDEYLVSCGAHRERIYRYPFTSFFKDEISQKVLSFEEKQNMKQVLNIKEKKVVIAVGQFIHRKGFDTFIKAIARVNEKSHSGEYGYLLVGGEPTEEYLKLQEQYHIKNLHYSSFKQKEELRKYYMAADLFVLPTRSDVWGLVINEAMACGLPVITTRNCVAGVEMIEGNGRLIDVDDEAQLAKDMAEILADDRLREQMSRKSLEIIKDYTIENMAQRHKELFEEIMRKRLTMKSQP